LEKMNPVNVVKSLNSRVIHITSVFSTIRNSSPDLTVPVHRSWGFSKQQQNGLETLTAVVEQLGYESREQFSRRTEMNFIKC